MRLFTGLFVVLTIVLAMLSPLITQSVEAETTTIDGNGQFFQQTASHGLGYSVVDGQQEGLKNAVRFFSEFKRLGSSDTLGFPISRRFVGADGFLYQAFQRGVLQWRPESDSAVLSNTFDWLHQAGRDLWLSSRGVPPPITDDGSAGDWLKARNTRLGWLSNSSIKEKFLNNPVQPGSLEASIQLYGLPMSSPEQSGPFIVQRFQRIAFQLWTDDVPGMPAKGSVVGVLGGDMLKEVGIIPASAVAPEQLAGRAGLSADGVKAVYVSYQAIGRDNYRQRVLDLATTTEINGFVIDVKNEHGFTTYRSNVPLAKEIDAANHPTAENLAALLTDFHKRGFYLIARLSLFKDDLLAKRRPSVAIQDAAGRPWRDAAGLGWTDPFQTEVWDYNIAIAKEAAALGFDEIQFDFIRFPVVGSSGAARYAQPSNLSTRTSAINGFLARARSELQPMGVKLSADLFGYTAWRQDDMGIGQQLDAMAKYLDVVSPMLYPSSFADGVPGFKLGVAHPYEIVMSSTQQAQNRLKQTPVLVRPWLQDFADYAFDRRPFTEKDVRAQIRGVADGGAKGWLLWDPYVRYTKEALAPR